MPEPRADLRPPQVSILCFPTAVVATPLNRSAGWAPPVRSGPTRAVATHEFFSRLRARNASCAGATAQTHATVNTSY